MIPLAILQQERRGKLYHNSYTILHFLDNVNDKVCILTAEM